MWTAPRAFIWADKLFHLPGAVIVSEVGLSTDDGWPNTYFDVRDWASVVEIGSTHNGFGPFLHTGPLGLTGTYVVAPHPYRLVLGAIYQDRSERFLEFDYPTEWQGASLGVFDSHFWISALYWILVVDSNAPAEATAVSAYYPHLSETSWSSWGTLPGQENPSLSTIAAASVVSLWDVGIGGLRTLLWRGDNLWASANFVTHWNAGGLGGLAFDGLSFDGSSMSNWLTVLRWADSCADIEGRMVFRSADWHQGNSTAGDLDGDGQDEIVWSTGTEIFVLGRGVSGALVLKARAATGARSVTISLVDGDDDGRMEIWAGIVTDIDGSGTAPGRVWRLP